MPGSKPEVHVEPAFCEVAKPIPEEPPSARKRPAWKTATTVLPAVTVWASTSVWCWLEELVNGSELTWTTLGGGSAAAYAGAGVRPNRADAATPRRKRVRQVIRNLPWSGSGGRGAPESIA